MTRALLMFNVSFGGFEMGFGSMVNHRQMLSHSSIQRSRYAAWVTGSRSMIVLGYLGLAQMYLK
ncbi:hypothetical protein ASE08_07065 [Rhizobacter sp. Root16D2]|nr:hypothetical protein ASC88_24320 [Rhizobacter sp. Root29]KRB18957.1 hypothetical protein ASE08_07065 [Rhizobacter sp. Root16D2]